MKNVKLQEGWKIDKLRNLVEINTGKLDANNEDIDGLYPFFTCAAEPIKINSYSFDDEAIILPGNGANVGLVLYYNGKFEAYQRTYVITKFSGELKYLYYYMKMYWKRYNDNKQYGSATNYIKMGNITEFDIVLPPIKVQKKIVEILERAEKALDNRKEAIKLLDELVKSRFIEMFGDLKRNSKEWNILAFDDFATIDTNMTKDFDKYSDYPHIGIDSIEKNTGNILEYQLVKYSNLKSGKYLFDERHIIYSKIRPNLNKVALPQFKGVCSADAYPVLCIDGITERNYFGYVLRSEFFLNYILAFSGRTNIPKVNKEQLKGFRMPTPPIELQNQFADFVNKVDNLKLKMESSLKELEDNFNSLMQRAFKGELF
ncbi:restriction endonuclease subunit S [Haloimpatiens massiliensis]|uniref:restriction endonuclease subunit S n=1 Tax=Haloimpatiens massiliensis TaxID=1658110 RepID=UPI000C848810|nr:restriction endonuclease subunit S [Haloimpatiens massiliensis]